MGIAQTIVLLCIEIMIHVLWYLSQNTAGVLESVICYENDTSDSPCTLLTTFYRKMVTKMFCFFYQRKQLLIYDIKFLLWPQEENMQDLQKAIYAGIIFR